LSLRELEGPLIHAHPGRALRGTESNLRDAEFDLGHGLDTSSELRSNGQPAGRAPIVAPQFGRLSGLDLARMGVTVSVVIPTLNEAQNLPHVLTRLPDGLHEVIIVDGHSTDDTVAVARQACPDARVLMQVGRGKGDALATGFAACTGDIVVTLDADGSTDAREIPRFVAALCSGADFVKGSRFAQGGASSDITRLRRWGNQALNALVNALYRTNFTDLCYGYNAFWARCLPYMRVDCDGFEVETLVNVRVAKAGLVIHEVPSFEHDRLSGASNLRAIRDGSRVLRTIVSERIAAAAWRYALAWRRPRRPAA
jgi:glycosyltransferase involved in cell wall biosynthesis